jgi:hypothetical protein
VAHDVDQASSCLPNTTHTGNSSCYSTCATAFDYHAAGYSTLPDSAVNVSYGLPCSWEAIAALDTTCTGRFNASFPVSKDIAPSTDSPTLLTWIDDVQVGWDQCAVHGYCASCIDESGEVNSYCAAVLNFYSSATASVSALNDLEYWCDEGTRGVIKAGNFTEKCTETAMVGVSGACDLQGSR